MTTQARIKRARELLAKWEATRDDSPEERDVEEWLAIEVQPLADELQRLAAALQHWGGHLDWCERRRRPEAGCNCGLAVVLQSLGDP